MFLNLGERESVELDSLGTCYLVFFFFAFHQNVERYELHFHIFRISANGDPLEKYYLWCLLCI